MVSKIRFFTDEDVYHAISRRLRARGFDAVSTPDTKRIGMSDESQLAWASEDDRVLVTFNVADFARLHHAWLSQGKHHTGLIVSQQRSIGEVLRGLIHLAENVTHEQMADRIEYLSNW